MLLDVELPSIVIVPLLLMIGLCLVLYGKEVIKALFFPIGALGGGILAYMVLEGFLQPYGVPLYIKLIVTIVMVFLGGLLGQGTTAMLIAFICSLLAMDLALAFVPDDLTWVVYVTGLIAFVGVIMVVQRFLLFFSSLMGGAFVSVALIPLLSPLDDPVARSVQVAIALLIGVIGYFVQRKLASVLKGRKEEVVWVPTPREGSRSKGSAQ